MRNGNIGVEIGGVDYSAYLAFPFVIQETGTEELDTAIVELHSVPRAAKFPPFTPVKLYGGKYEYIIANDAVKEVYGRKRWKHELTLMHPTKNAERVLMEAKAFTQPLVPNYGDGKTYAEYIHVFGNEVKTGIGQSMTTPVVTSKGRVNVASWAYAVEGAGLKETQIGGGTVVFDHADVRILYGEGRTVIADGQSVSEEGLDVVYSETNIGKEDELAYYTSKAGVYTICYETFYTYSLASGYISTRTYYPVAMVNDEFKDTPYTLLEAVKILLECAEPLRKDLDTQRFTLDLTEEQEAFFEATRSPEFHFANGRSLLENLSVIGGFIHAIPRVSLDGKVSFKDIGLSEKADLSKGEQFAAEGQANAADYAHKIETNFSNLVNIDDETEGSIDHPYKGGFITLRGDDARIKEETAKIKLPFPCEKVLRLTAVYNLVEYDLTKYLFEKSEYDLLTAYSGIFPFSKTFAIYYTQGGTEIDGLWYRAEDQAVSILNSFQKYAIANILYDASDGALDLDGEGKDAYLNIAFRVSYVPVINGRARQQRTDEASLCSIVLAHNQSANKMSARAFGQSLRGKVEMLTGASDSVSYMFRTLDDVPHPWTLYDDRYISTVTTRVFPLFCLSQLTLTPNYNALGQYAELNTAIRQYEIPAGETRYTLLEEYCIIGSRSENDDQLICAPAMRRGVVEAFNEATSKDLTAASVKTFDEDMTQISPNLTLPLFSTSLGNSLYFGFSFQDNFSAGTRSGNVAPSLAYRSLEHVAYGDPFYSRAKYLDFTFYDKYKAEAEDLIEVANNLPLEPPRIGTLYALTGAHPLVLNKDSADACNIAYQMHFVSDDGIIIGAGLAQMMPFVRTDATKYAGKAKMYFYSEEVNHLTGEPKEASLVGEAEVTGSYEGGYKLLVGASPVSFKSWVIKKQNGAVLLAKNATEAPTQINIAFRRKLGG